MWNSLAAGIGGGKKSGKIRIRPNNRHFSSTTMLIALVLLLSASYHCHAFQMAPPSSSFRTASAVPLPSRVISCPHTTTSLNNGMHGMPPLQLGNNANVIDATSIRSPSKHPIAIANKVRKKLNKIIHNIQPPSSAFILSLSIFLLTAFPNAAWAVRSGGRMGGSYGGGSRNRYQQSSRSSRSYGSPSRSASSYSRGSSLSSSRVGSSSSSRPSPSSSSRPHSSSSSSSSTSYSGGPRSSSSQGSNSSRQFSSRSRTESASSAYSRDASRGSSQPSGGISDSASSGYSRDASGGSGRQLSSGADNSGGTGYSRGPRRGYSSGGLRPNLMGRGRGRGYGYRGMNPFYSRSFYSPFSPFYANPSGLMVRRGPSIAGIVFRLMLSLFVVVLLQSI